MEHRWISEALTAMPGPANRTPRVALYAAFHSVMQSDRLVRKAVSVDALSRLRSLPPDERAAFLLTAVEGFNFSEAANILNLDGDRFDAIFQRTSGLLDRLLQGRVLLGEPEPVISSDLGQILSKVGHAVIGPVATAEDLEIAIAVEHPDLLITETRMADGASSLPVVMRALETSDTKVMFVTAWPEDLLRGERPHDTFLVTKPFKPETVRAAVAQIMFFKPGRLNSQAPMIDPASTMVPSGEGVAPPARPVETMDMFPSVNKGFAITTANDQLAFANPALKVRGDRDTARALWNHVRRDADRLAAEPRLSNRPSLRCRLGELAPKLDWPLSTSAATVYSVQVEAFALLLSHLAPELEDELAGDLAAFQLTLARFVRRLDVDPVEIAPSRTFAEPVDARALKDATDAILAAPTEIVDPEVAGALRTLQEASDDETALQAPLLAEIFRAIGRAVFGKQGEFGSNLRRAAHTWLFTTVGVGGVSGTLGIILARAAPRLFGFLHDLMRLL